jgi:hypothetical protein
MVVSIPIFGQYRSGNLHLYAAASHSVMGLLIRGQLLVVLIHHPHHGLIAIGAKLATVVGSKGWLCDAMATAVMVAGQDGAKWFGQPELSGYQVFAVDRHEQTGWSI